MTKEEKQNMDLDIINQIKAVTASQNVMNAAMYIRGDAENNNAMICIEGDVKLLANTLIHHIENNPKFNQFIMAVVGSYLCKNPDKEKEFNEGIILMKNSFGIN
jgi:hypothetical protein